MSQKIGFLKSLNFRSLYFNLKYLPLKDAVKLPFLISSRVFLLETGGEVHIKGPIKRGMIKIGFGNIGIFDMKRSRSVWHVSGKVIFEGKAHIGHGTKISVNKDALLEIGRNFRVTAESEIIVQKHVKVGENVLMSWDCLIMDTDFHNIYDSAGKVINSPKPIIIGDKVWIGCRNVILKGSKISSNSILGANSLVKSDISNQSGIFAGNPVKFVKGDVTW